MTKTGSSNAGNEKYGSGSSLIKNYEVQSATEALTGTTASSNLRKTSGSDGTGSHNAMANTMSSGGGLTRATVGSSGSDPKNMLPAKSQGTIPPVGAKSNGRGTGKKQFSASHGAGKNPKIVSQHRSQRQLGTRKPSMPDT